MSQFTSLCIFCSYEEIRNNAKFFKMDWKSLPSDVVVRSNQSNRYTQNICGISDDYLFEVTDLVEASDTSSKKGSVIVIFTFSDHSTVHRNWPQRTFWWSKRYITVAQCGWPKIVQNLSLFIMKNMLYAYFPTFAFDELQVNSIRMDFSWSKNSRFDIWISNAMWYRSVL